MNGRPTRSWPRRLFLAAVFLGGFALAAGAAYAYRTLPLRAVEIDGARRARPTELVRLAALPDTIVIADVNPRLVADRMQRHPWVRRAHVRRLPTGTLKVSVEERRPAALVMGADGRPRHYLDAEGFEMPLPVTPDGRPSAVYDVPLLSGAVPEAPTGRPVASAPLVELLGALAAAAPAVDALVSEVRLGRGGDAVLLTAPVSGHPALTVRLGTEGFAERLVRLRAFYDQAVLPRPGHPFETIDLRFDGQIVTREGLGPGTSGLGNAAAPASITETVPVAEPTPTTEPAEPTDSSDAH